MPTPLRLIIVFLLIAALGACATAPRQHHPSQSTGQKPENGAPAPPYHGKDYSHIANPAVVALLNEADAAENNGHPNASAGALERAIDITPANPLLWHRLAALYLKQGNGAQARAMAEKSNSLISGDTALRRRNRQIIKQAETLQRGNHNEAKTGNTSTAED